jgi:hypothetical protein
MARQQAQGIQRKLAKQLKSKLFLNKTTLKMNGSKKPPKFKDLLSNNVVISNKIVKSMSSGERKLKLNFRK